MQDSQCSEEMEHNNNSEANDSNKDDLSENISEEIEQNNNSEVSDSSRQDSRENSSSQESQSSRKLLVTKSRNISGEQKKVNKCNCKKGAREKVCRDNLHCVLVHNHKKLGIKECGNRINFCSSIVSSDGKSEHNVSFDNFQQSTSNLMLKEEACYLL